MEPWHTNAQTIVNITYCNNLSLFNFNILGRCNIEKTTIKNIIYSGSNNAIIEDYNITFENSWTNYNKSGTERSKINYKNNVVNINFKIKSGTVQKQNCKGLHISIKTVKYLLMVLIQINYCTLNLII